jgi:hypothetical protein
MNSDPSHAGRPNARREQRETWVGSHTGEIKLRIPGLADVPVDVVRNASASGASVLVREKLAVGTAANVVIRAAGATLEFMANVAWCRLAGPGDLTHSDVAGSSSYALGLSIRAPGSFAAMLQDCE